MRIGGAPAERWFGIWLTIWPRHEHREVMRNEGVEDIPLLGRTFRATKISRYREGAEGNWTRLVGLSQGRASNTMLNGVSAALRTRSNPPSLMTDDSFAKPACAPSAAPTG